MQYENNPANGFRYIILKQKARMHRRTARYCDDNIPRPYSSWRGLKFHTLPCLTVVATLKYFCINHEYQFEISINVLVGSFRFI